MRKGEVFIGEGKYAKCYVKDGIVRKYYKDDVPEDQKDTIGIKNDTFIFATMIDYEKKYSEMPYIPNCKPFIVLSGNDYKNDYEPVADPKINEFIDALPKVYSDMDELSAIRVRPVDTLGHNILFGDGKFKVVDTDQYYKDELFSPYAGEDGSLHYLNEKHTLEFIKEDNIICLNYGLYDCIFYTEKKHKIPMETLALRTNEGKLRKLYHEIFFMNNPDRRLFIEFLKELKKFFNIENDRATINDFRIALSRKMNR